MLQKLSEEIRLCYGKAEACARQAGTAPTEALRADYLKHEQTWLKLARSYELQQRSTLLINGIGTHKHAEYRAPALADVDRRAAEAASAGLSGPGKADGEPDHRQGGLIAIVDDDECARAGLRCLIESLGQRAATFASAEDYLAARASAHAACLILDVHLPGMSGPDLQAHLIAAARCPPVIFATGRFEEHVRKRVIEAGALGYLMKPCSERALLDCIAKVVAQPQRCDR